MFYFVGFIFYVLITEKCPNSPSYIRYSIIFTLLEIIFLEPSELLYSCSCRPMICYIPVIFHHLHPGDILCLFLKGKKIPFSGFPVFLLLRYSLILVQHSCKSFLRKDTWEVNFFKPLNTWKCLPLPLIC